MAVDVRCSWPEADWESWKLPEEEDSSNPAILRRIVAEWASLQTLTDRLRAIDSNPEVAIGKLLATYELVHTYGLQAARPEPSQLEPAEPVNDFEISLNDDL